MNYPKTTNAVDESNWVDVAISICVSGKSRRSMSEVKSLVRGLRWVKHFEEVQQALDALCECPVYQGGVLLQKDQVEKAIGEICKFKDMNWAVTER